MSCILICITEFMCETSKVNKKLQPILSHSEMGPSVPHARMPSRPPWLLFPAMRQCGGMQENPTVPGVKNYPYCK